MTKEDLLALPAAIRGFNGFYGVRGKFILINSIRMLIVYAVIVVLLLAGFVWILVRYIRKRRRIRRLRAAAS